MTAKYKTARYKAPIALAWLCCALAVSPAAAQSPPSGKPPEAPVSPPRIDTKACADERRATIGSGDTLQAPHPDATTSDRLAQTDGVICPPPDIDPNIRAPAPGGGTTPVIPPPGSPGGDPNVKPK
jgi:hypothetical protein